MSTMKPMDPDETDRLVDIAELIGGEASTPVDSSVSIAQVQDLLRLCTESTDRSESVERDECDQIADAEEPPPRMERIVLPSKPPTDDIVIGNRAVCARFDADSQKELLPEKCERALDRLMKEPWSVRRTNAICGLIRLLDKATTRRDARPTGQAREDRASNEVEDVAKLDGDRGIDDGVTVDGGTVDGGTVDSAVVADLEVPTDAGPHSATDVESSSVGANVRPKFGLSRFRDPVSIETE